MTDVPVARTTGIAPDGTQLHPGQALSASLCTDHSEWVSAFVTSGGAAYPKPVGPQPRSVAQNDPPLQTAVANLAGVREERTA